MTHLISVSRFSCSFPPFEWYIDSFSSWTSSSINVTAWEGLWEYDRQTVKLYSFETPMESLCVSQGSLSWHYMQRCLLKRSQSMFSFPFLPVHSAPAWDSSLKNPCLCYSLWRKREKRVLFTLHPQFFFGTRREYEVSREIEMEMNTHTQERRKGEGKDFKRVIWCEEYCISCRAPNTNLLPFISSRNP